MASWAGTTAVWKLNIHVQALKESIGARYLSAMITSQRLDGNAENRYERLGIAGQRSSDVQCPIKVALFIRNFQIGGAEKQMLELAKHLDKTRYEVTIIALRGGGELSEPFHSLPNVQVVILDSVSPLMTMFRLTRVIRSRRIEILHSFLTATNVYSLFAKLLLRRVKLVLGLRDSIADFYMGYDSLWWRSKLWALEICLNRLAYLGDLYVSNSEAGKALYDTKLHVKSVVIANGVDTDRFKPDPSVSQRLRKILGVPDATRVVGILGNCTLYKDHPTFVRAAKIVAEKIADVHFLLIGEDRNPLGADLKKLVHQSDLEREFHFLGTRMDVGELLPGLDVLCSSSITEGFPSAIAEAMACGVPCVATDVGDSRRIVGDTGIVVPAGSPQTLAAGVVALLNQDPVKLQDMRSCARLRIVQDFDVARMSMRHEHIYDSLASRNARSLRLSHSGEYSRDV
jgi:glycosyltransferase involved in cell wall biosynthesis